MAIIRKSLKLDEFPQLYNVLKGDINLNWPKNHLKSQTELDKARLLNGIHQIKPGITGFSQILGYDMSDPVKLLKLIRLYMKHKSLNIDFYNFNRYFY